MSEIKKYNSELSSATTCSSFLWVSLTPDWEICAVSEFHSSIILLVASRVEASYLGRYS